MDTLTGDRWTAPSRPAEVGTEVPGTSLLSRTRLAAPRGQEKVEIKAGMLMGRWAGPKEHPGCSRLY